MKRKRHSPEQIIRKLWEAGRMLSEAKTIAEVCPQLEIADATFHRWRHRSDDAAAEATRDAANGMRHGGGGVNNV